MKYYLQTLFGRILFFVFVQLRGSALTVGGQPQLQEAGCSSLPCGVLCLVTQSCLTLYDSMDYSPSGSSVHGDSPGKNSGVGCHTLLQGIFPTQGLNPDILHFRQSLHCLSHLLAILVPNMAVCLLKAWKGENVTLARWVLQCHTILCIRNTYTQSHAFY